MKDRKREGVEKEALRAAYENDPIALLEDGGYELLDELFQEFYPDVQPDDDHPSAPLDEHGQIPF